MKKRRLSFKSRPEMENLAALKQRDPKAFAAVAPRLKISLGHYLNAKADHEAAAGS